MLTTICKNDIIGCCDFLKIKLLSRLPFGSKMDVMYSDSNYIIILIEREFGAKESFSARFKIKIDDGLAFIGLLERAEANILKFLNGRFFK